MAWELRLTFSLEGEGGELLLFIFELDLRGVDGGSGFILVGGESWKRVGRSDSGVILPNPHGLQLPQENPHYYRSLYVEYIYFQLSGIRYPSSPAVS